MALSLHAYYSSPSACACLWRRGELSSRGSVLRPARRGQLNSALLLPRRPGPGNGGLKPCRSLLLARAFWNRKSKQSVPEQQADSEGASPKLAPGQEGLTSEEGVVKGAASNPQGSGSDQEDGLLDLSQFQGEGSAEIAADQLAESTPLVVELVAQEGDSLESLAASFGVDIQKFIMANGGSTDLQPGDKLRFQLPLPSNPEELQRLLAGMQLEEEDHTEVQRSIDPPGKQQNASPRPLAATIGYLLPWLLLGSAALLAFSLARFKGRLVESERQALRERATAKRRQMQAGTPPALEVHDSSKEEISGSRAEFVAPDWKDSRLSALQERLRSGRRATTSGAASEDHLYAAGAPSEEPEAAEPGWLKLSAVHFLMLRGHRSPSYRLQPQLPDEYTWVAWEAEGDAKAMLEWLSIRGDAGDGDTVAAVDPFEFLRLADVSGKGVSFFATQSVQITRDTKEDDLRTSMLSAAKNLPRQPLYQGQASVQSILKDRLGIAHKGQPAQKWKKGDPADKAGQVHMPAKAPPQGWINASANGDPVIDVELAGQLPPPETASPYAAQTDSRAHQDHTEAASALAPGKHSDTNPSLSIDAKEPGASKKPPAHQASASHAGPETKEAVSEMGEDHDPDKRSPRQNSRNANTSQEARREDDGERTDEYAAMVEDLMKIRRKSQKAGYVPKIARQFAEEFIAKEQTLKEAAAIDPNFRPVQAAEQAEAADLELALSKESVDTAGATSGAAEQSESDSGKDPAVRLQQSSEEYRSPFAAVQEQPGQLSGSETARDDHSGLSARLSSQNSTESSNLDDEYRSKNDEQLGVKLGSETFSSEQASSGFEGPASAIQVEAGTGSPDAASSADPEHEANLGDFEGVLSWVDQATAAFSKRLGQAASSAAAAVSSNSTSREEHNGSTQVLDTRAEQAAPGGQATASSSGASQGQTSAAPQSGKKQTLPREGTKKLKGAPKGSATTADLVWQAEMEEEARRARAAETELTESFAASELFSDCRDGSPSHGGSGTATLNGSSAQAAAPRKHRTDWWKRLPVIFLPTVEEPNGPTGYVMVDVSSNAALEDFHVFGFAHIEDANKFAWFFRSHSDSSCRIVAATPTELMAEGVGEKETGMTVFRQGELPLSPGMHIDELPVLLAAYAH